MFIISGGAGNQLKKKRVLVNVIYCFLCEKDHWLASYGGVLCACLETKNTIEMCDLIVIGGDVIIFF